MPRRNKDNSNSGDGEEREPELVYSGIQKRYAAPHAEEAIAFITGLLRDYNLTYRQAQFKTGVNFTTISTMAKGQNASWESVFRFFSGMRADVNKGLYLFGYPPLEFKPSDWRRMGLTPCGYELTPVEGEEQEPEDETVESFRIHLDKTISQFPEPQQALARKQIAEKFEELFDLAAASVANKIRRSR